MSSGESELAARELLGGRALPLRETIQELNRLELGRPLVRGIYKMDRLERDVIGYVLPLDAEHHSHLVMFEDGTLITTAPDEGAALPLYVDEMSKQDLKDFGPEVTNEKVLESLTMLTSMKVVLKNDKEANSTQIDEAVGKAIEVATAVKVEREKVRIESALRARDRFRPLFEPKP